ncbi:MAG: MgtC/SapB family protein [Pleurocapsa sp. MO_192.B19]|nr:MgtC/SapB family protein [Pleurocapsa sp. MO_192.B19]
MDTISWSEIAIRLLFTFVLGGATAIEKRWHLTRKLIKSNTQMALSAAMFAMLTSLTSKTIFSSHLILGISIICAGILLQKQADTSSVNTAIKLWCAGAAGSLVGYGFFLPAYFGILAIILTNLLFQPTEREFIPNIEAELNDHPRLSLPIKPEIEIAERLIPITPQKTKYRYQVICLAENEIEILALLVKLLKEQKIMPTGISSKNLANNHTLPEVEIEVDFIFDANNNHHQLQQVLSILKSKVEVNSASWLYLSLDSTNKKNDIFYRQEVQDRDRWQ